jgi:tellurite resistance protein TerC
VFRSIFIVAGLAVLEMFHWSMYVFGSFLLGTGVWMMVKKGEQYDPERNPAIRLFRRYFPIANRYEADRFFVRKHGAWLATPLFVVLLAIESSDIVFAIDSIPAIFAITQDHFIVYTSNIFAMLGLRAMYFAVASFMRSFHYLHYGFASIIVILGIKMLLSDVYHVPVTLSLVLIVLILMASMIVSLLRPRAEDLKRILQRSQRLGVLSFRRLLLLENVFQLEKLRVREAMRPRPRVHVLRADAPWEVNRRLMVETRLSRYPVVDTTDRPLGIVHVKDLFLRGVQPTGGEAWRTIAHPAVAVAEEALLEDLLMNLKAQRQSLALVFDQRGQWTGLVTFQDVIEEIVGRSGDEFEPAPAVPLATLTPGRITLDVDASTVGDAMSRMAHGAGSAALPAGVRERLHHNGLLTHNYLGNGVLLATGVEPSLEAPVALFGRSDTGVPMDASDERASLLFLVLLPSHPSHSQLEIRESISSLMESDYLRERLLQADKPQMIIDAIREGIQVALD